MATVAHTQFPITRVPKLLLGVVVAVTTHAPSMAQSTRINDASAKEAVHRIVRYSGLLPTFTLREDGSIRTANAYVKGRERIIAYNPAFISGIVDSAHTDRAAVSILAHEIAHHLLGHTLDPQAMHPGDELACDRYSGFILYHMGATIQESLAAIDVAGNVHGTRTHPPRHARAAAIRQGWNEAREQVVDPAPVPFTLERMFQFVVSFAGDANTYYVDDQGCLVWFNNYAEPIEFGSCTRIGPGPWAYELIWTDQHYQVDPDGVIWYRTASGMQMNVGRMEPFGGK